MGTTKPKWPRESRTKKVEEYAVLTDRGGIPCRTYRQKGEGFESSSHWLGVALIDEVPMRETSKSGEGIDVFEQRFRGLVKEAAELDWRPYLYVQTGEDGVSRHMESRAIDSSISLLVQVCEVELAGVDSGEKFHRWGRHDFRGREGWPEIGDRAERSWDGTVERMGALVPDTPINREAIDAMRRGMDQLRGKLMAALSPGNIDKALAGAAAGLLGPGPRATGNGERKS